jgi:hypothetical protein
MPAIVLLAATVVALAGSAAVRQPQPEPRDVSCEFRVFNGEADVTAETRLRVYPAGQRAQPRDVEPGRTLVFPSGFYDVQAVRQRDGVVVNIRWAERILVQRYPDEGAHHLEVINFDSRYGAVQVVLPEGTDSARSRASACVAGSPTPAGHVSRGDGYLLIVLPAGRYDVSLTAPRGQGADAPAITRTVANVLVRADAVRTVPVRGFEARRPLLAPRQATVRRPVNRFTRNRISAMTSSAWISPPATSRAKPSTHNTNNTTMSVQSIATPSPGLTVTERERQVACHAPLSSSMHKFGNVFVPSGLSAE